MICIPSPYQQTIETPQDQAGRAAATIVLSLRGCKQLSCTLLQACKAATLIHTYYHCSVPPKRSSLFRHMRHFSQPQSGDGSPSSSYCQRLEQGTNGPGPYSYCASKPAEICPPPKPLDIPLCSTDTVGKSALAAG